MTRRPALALQKQVDDAKAASDSLQMQLNEARPARPTPGPTQHGQVGFGPVAEASGRNQGSLDQAPSQNWTTARRKWPQLQKQVETANGSTAKVQAKLDDANAQISDLKGPTG